MSNLLKYMRLFALGITFSSSMALPYVQIKFYDVFREATQASNNELGLLMTIFTAVSMALYIPGGVLADRGSPKKLLLLSLIMMCGLNAYFAFHTSYGAAQLIWALLAVSANMIQWPTLIKAVRDTGSKEEQGRMFGTFYGATGIFSSLIGFAGAALYSSVDDRIQGFHYMLYGQAVIAVLALIAVAMWWWPTLSRVLDPYLVVLNALPKTALGPIFIVWMGAGTGAIIVMTLAISLIVTILNMYEGFRATDAQKTRLMAAMGASRWQLLRMLVFPASFPTLFNTLKVNVGLSWVGVIMGEFLVSRAGLGYLIVYGSQVFNMDLVMTSVLLLLAAAVIMYRLVLWVEKILYRLLGVKA